MSDADARLAARLAREAGDLLLKIRESGGDDLMRRGDAESNAFLLAELAACRPDDAVLSEEAADDPARLGASRVWIVDPLDGTREYGRPGRVDWAVHVALWQRGRGIMAAAVAVPGLNLVHASDDVVRKSAPAPAVPRILVSDSRPPSFAAAVADDLGAVLTPMGSAGAKATAVLRGEAEAFVHAGGQWEWDSAAPVGVALAAGLHASRVDGSPLVYNRPHPYLPDLLICRADAAPRVLAAIRAT
ncbi:3'(2'),5'-bisphosphate nucleotidase CysQ [Saccharothrix violaceirubra]|uniref:3'(2'),5-bisphosphonucleoside 3'(2')-phosphohydrolase n=1 Tax=Saccharothrix violaceirubra TaxID=413306 RepID=A0A7W7WXH0_9PSEU|nr:3'(2'),5'-bisphosphate nucleotidase CysQ [Saccharothrix violaceirubra]MBB4967385.1 3'-phosphoadenosine 5'-phosphosulfate (PAPS) 3'-phosphatase [Saccharothrix violaceirubra]